MALTQVQNGMIGTVNSLTDSSGAVYGGLYGFKNRIINGGMTIDQRNNGASVSPTANTYTLDRWDARLSQASKYSVQQSSVAPNGFRNSLLVTSLSAYTVGSSENFFIKQVIEGFNIADLMWGTANAQTVVLSFQVRSSLTGTFGGSLWNSDGSRSYPFTYTISAANTYETKTVTIAGDTSGTWLTTNGAGINVGFGLGVGSSLSGTAGAWASSFFPSATGATSVVGTSGATFYITGVQLEKGSTATNYDVRSYGTELALCQRYFYATDSNGICAGIANTGSRTWGNVVYPVRMRAAPTASVTGVLQISDNYSADFTATATLVAHQGTAVGCRINFDGFTGLTIGRYYAGYTTGTPSGQIFYSAEL